MRLHNLPYLLASVCLSGCTGEEEPECTEFEEVFVWADEDGDGFGRDEPIGYVCKAAAGQATNMADCDDEDATTYPNAVEVCDEKDNNCNEAVDEDQPKLRWYRDADADTYGTAQDAVLACVAPEPTYILQAGDCADDDAGVNPSVLEICDGIDNDCDSLTDDADGGVDPTTFTRWYRDGDSDTYGDPLTFADQCLSPGGYVLDSSDCDDTRDEINPLGSEVCNDRDDDCDSLTDDEDDSIDPATQVQLYGDADADGYGDINAPVLVCEPTIGIGVLNSDDCDDTNPRANVEQDWYADIDGDGYGTEPAALFQCPDPGPDYAPSGAGLDCDDADSAIHPNAPVTCGDPVDRDCSGSHGCGSCKDWQTALGAYATSGVYAIAPLQGYVADVYCDMDTDGGGWTLVASTTSGLDDAGSYPPYSDLQTLEPTGVATTVWAGMRPWIFSQSSGRSDIRFACKNIVSGPFDVDLSFYDTIWYYEITFGDDLDSCFNENTGIGADPPPARTNNLTGATLPAGDPWSAGYLEGEDSCGDQGDFTVDFDDRGMDSNQADGTDWGEDDSTRKCGVSSNGMAYFIFVREL